MFTGIIETTGRVTSIERDGSNIHFNIKSEISNQLKIDQSIAHDGVCLTVVKVIDDVHRVTAIQETLDKTALNLWKENRIVNLERCMKSDGRFDGHIVQGHVDTTTRCLDIQELNGSWQYRFALSKDYAHNFVPQGSITINGVSLTVSGLTDDYFQVSIIPYTYEHTTFKQLTVEDSVNLEFDIIGKYIARVMELRG